MADKQAMDKLNFETGKFALKMLEELTKHY